MSSQEVGHLATAASAATSAIFHLIQRPALTRAVAAHPALGAAMALMLEEHSYVRLRLLFPGLLIAPGTRPASARRKGAQVRSTLASHDGDRLRTEASSILALQSRCESSFRMTVNGEASFAQWEACIRPGLL